MGQAADLAAENQAAWPDRLTKYHGGKECTKDEPALG